MHDFRAYIFAKAPPPQRGLSAIAELLVLVLLLLPSLFRNVVWSWKNGWTDQDAAWQKFLEDGKFSL